MVGSIKEIKAFVKSRKEYLFNGWIGPKPIMRKNGVWLMTEWMAKLYENSAIGKRSAHFVG